jgi:hypothetical protein
MDLSKCIALGNDAVTPVSVKHWVHRQVSGGHFNSLAVENGHVAEGHERLLPGVALENPKATGGEHPLRVFKSQPLFSEAGIQNSRSGMEKPKSGRQRMPTATGNR